MRKIAFIALLLSLLPFVLISQHAEYPYEHDLSSTPDWIQLMYAPQPDIGEVVKAYESYYVTHDFVKNKYTQYYKRWLRSITRDHSGKQWADGPTRQKIKENQKNYVQHSIELKNSEQRLGKNSSGSWFGIGPYDFDKEAESRSYAAGAAHIYTVEQAASDSDVLYAGTATAGLWKSEDHGASWDLMTSDLLIGSIRAIEIDHGNPNIVYFGASGSLYKSTSGGSTWNTIGDSGFNSLDHSIEDIVLHPSNPSILFLTSDNGFYRSVDGGANWTRILSGEFQEIEIHPTNTDIIYTIELSGDQTNFYKSINNGLSFSIQANGWPNPGSGDEQKRTEIAVTPDEPDYVYALATGSANGGSGLYGIYLSQDMGATWSFQCCGPQPAGAPNAATNPNLMAWQDDGSDDGGQYYYDLGLDVSPTNADSVFVGGVNLWISGDGGSSFVCPSKWSHSYKPNYVHADIHDIRFFNNNLWIACDGGIFYSEDSGSTFDRMMNGIHGTDFWGFGAGFSDGQVMLGGTYHNGTLLKDNNVYNGGWLSTHGGDNIRGFVNFGNSRQVYHDGGGRTLPGDRNVSLSSFTFSKIPNAHYIVGMTSNIEFDPQCYNIVYTTEDGQLWKSLNNGSSFDLIHDFGGDRITEVRVAWDNPDKIYVVQYPSWWGDKKLWKTTDGGSSWTDITPAIITTDKWAPFDIAVDAQNSDIIWLARMQQYASYDDLNGQKIYKSSNGGSSWTNITTSTLDGEYITNIVHQKGTDGGIYLGTRRAVYYRNNSLSDWELFNTGLPVNTFSTKLVPYYGGGVIRNGTNRSVYESDLYETSDPVAQISADRLISSCSGEVVNYIDHSVLSGAGASWAWTFEGGNPATSNLQNPAVTYNTSGSYDVTLTVTDANGSDAQTIVDFITIEDGCSVDTIPGLGLHLVSAGDYCISPPLDMTSSSPLTISAWVKPNGIQSDYTGIVTGSDETNTFGFNLRPNNELAYHWPGGQWWWSSGLTVPSGEWSHVAFVLDNNSITVYLNGVGRTHNITPGSVDFSLASMYIGSYLGWTSRNFNGDIDEVCIWDEAKSQSQIRELRHLTRVPQTDNSLVRYYQFNDQDANVLDKVGGQHGQLAGGAMRTGSTAPLGGGVSYTLDVSTGGVKDFTSTGLVMTFSNTGTYPDGDLVVTRINLNPDQNPDLSPVSRSYWVINNYGNNSAFNSLTEMRFNQIGRVTAGEAAEPAELSLHKRASNADGASWAVNDKGDLAIAGVDGDVVFSEELRVENFSQFIVSHSNNALPVDGLTFVANLVGNKEVHLKWSTLSEINSDKFVLQRSRDGVLFNDIGVVQASGNTADLSTYQFVDYSPLRGSSYYRIKQLDKDGIFVYSDIRSITWNARASEIVVYPNILNAGDQIFIKNNIANNVTMRIYSDNGSLLFKDSFYGDHAISTFDWVKGVYFYSISWGSKRKNGKLLIGN